MNNPTIEQLKQAKADFQLHVREHIAIQMEEFHRQTGLLIGDVKVDIIEHSTMGEVDDTVLLGVECEVVIGRP